MFCVTSETFQTFEAVRLGLLMFGSLETKQS